MSRYTIILKNCSFFARHGLLEQEEVLGQRFFVDAEMEVEAGDALETDDIENTVDYGVAFAVIEKIVVGQRRYLIEALANDIAKALQRLLDDPDLAAALGRAARARAASFTWERTARLTADVYRQVLGA